MHTLSRSTRSVRLVLGMTAALFLGGCAGGGYTSEHVSAAKEKLDIMKAATDWQTAHQAFLAGDLKKALKAIDRSLALNAKVPKSHVLRGRILMEQSNMEEAFKSFAKAAELDAGNAEAPYYTGIAYERIAKPDRALEYYSKAADADPASAQYAIAAAESLIDLGKLDDAEQYLVSRQTAFEHSPGARQTLGHIASLRGEPEKAIVLFNEARLLAPDDSGITEDLIRAQVACAKYNDAEFNLAKLLQNPQYAERRDLQHLRVRGLVALDRLFEAREISIKLTTTEVGKTDVQAWIDLGNIAYMLKDDIRTKQAAARVLTLAPDRPDGYLMQGLYQRSHGELAQAAANFQRAAALKPDAQTLVMLGVVQRDLKQTAAAKRSFQQALQQDPADPNAAQLLAEVGTDQ